MTNKKKEQKNKKPEFPKGIDGYIQKKKWKQNNKK